MLGCNDPEKNAHQSQSFHIILKKLIYLSDSCKAKYCISIHTLRSSSCITLLFFQSRVEGDLWKCKVWLNLLNLYIRSAHQLTSIICLTIKSFFRGWLFLLFLCDNSLWFRGDIVGKHLMQIILSGQRVNCNKFQLCKCLRCYCMFAIVSFCLLSMFLF